MTAGRVGGFKSWRCSACGEQIVEGQRFFVLPRVGLVHAECVWGLLGGGRGSVDPDLLALLDASEAVSYAIVRFKQAERAAGASSRLLSSARKRLESIAAELERELGRALEERGVLGGGGSEA